MFNDKPTTMSDKETKERIERDAIALATAISSNPFMNKADIKNPEGKKHRPDFPEWIKSKEGEDCLKWPISEVKYLHNRLFWAFDAGRNCVWDQYITKKAELQKAKELNGELVNRSAQQLKEYREVIKELLPLAEAGLKDFLPESRGEVKAEATIERARKLIDQTDSTK